MAAITLSKAFLYLFLLLIGRKILIALIAMRTVQIHWDDVSFEKMIDSSSFNASVLSIPAHQTSYVLILNKHALNMTMNWLCNTETMNGVHESSLVVTLDEESANFLEVHRPHLRQLKWIVPALKNPFNYGDGHYQLFYLFRSNLARALVHFDRTFWMIQQDTFWADSLDTVETEDIDGDIVFDRASESGPLIAGGYYLARPTNRSKEFFQKLSQDISWWYAPDNAYMTSLCQLSGTARCGALPFSIITNWQWLDQPSDVPPVFVQFDGETKLGGKLAKMKTLGFYFLNEDGLTCNASSLQTARAVLEDKTSRWSEVASYSHGQFKLYQNIVDALYSNSASAYLLDRFILPYAHFCMLTL